MVFGAFDIDDRDDLEDPNKLLRNNGQISTSNSRGGATDSDHHNLEKQSDSLICCKWLSLISAVDKRYSNKIHMMDSSFVEFVLFLFAHMWNRWYAIFPIAGTFFIGYYGYDEMLVENGFKPLGPAIASSQKRLLGLTFMLFFGFVLLVNVCCTQCMKYTLKRERPERIPGT